MEIADELTVAAYDPRTKEVVIIALNDGDKPRPVRYDLSGFDSLQGEARRWLTEPARQARHQPQPPLSPAGKHLDLTLAPKSVQTLVIGATGRAPR